MFQSLILGPIEFKTFIMNWMMGQLAPSTSLQMNWLIPVVCVTVQKNHDNMEEWTNKNFMKYKKGACQVLHLHYYFLCDIYTWRCTYIFFSLSNNLINIVVIFACRHMSIASQLPFMHSFQLICVDVLYRIGSVKREKKNTQGLRCCSKTFSSRIQITLASLLLDLWSNPD